MNLAHRPGEDRAGAMAPALPADFIRTVTGIFGADGARMLERLPESLRACSARWSLSLGPHFPDLSINYVAPALLPDGSEAVLKVCVPNQEYTTETEALRLYDGRGAARLLATDPDHGAMLLERVRPGAPLWDTSEDEAIDAALAVMGRLFRPAPAAGPFPTVADWAAGLGRLRARFNGGAGPLPLDLVDAAERLFLELLAEEREPVLLHGDLHHGNILRAGPDGYLAIDPKGIVGEAAFESTAFMLNPEMDWNDEAGVRRTFARRLDRFAEALAVDRERLRAWSIARAVLSASWSVEEGSGWEAAIATARLLTSC